MRFIAKFVIAGLAGAVCQWATAQLTFEAELYQDGKAVDASDLAFVRVPLKEYRRHDPVGHALDEQGQKRGQLSSSGNWCGATQHSTTSNPISSVSGYFVTPSLSLRAGIPAPQSAAAWVGIDGASCQTALLQTGVTVTVSLSVPKRAY